MRVALCEETNQLVIDTNAGEYRGLLGYLASHIEFGFVPDSVYDAWIQNPTRTTRDVLQFAFDHSVGKSRELAQTELDAMALTKGTEDDLPPAFVIVCEHSRPILGMLPGISPVRYSYDDCVPYVVAELVFVLAINF